MLLAIALQGIGGMNSFASGVLDVFKKNQIEPDLISATSGAIISAFHYLYPDKGAERYNQVFNTGYGPWVDRANLIWSFYFGMPGMFRPLYQWERYLKEFPLDTPQKWLNFFFPSQAYVSLVSDDFFGFLAEGFAESKTGIIINSYNYFEDKAILYVNEAARKKALLKLLEYQDIEVKEMCTDGVIAGLRLLQLGDYKGEYDGAYQYNPILYPLVVSDHIIVVTVQPIHKAIQKRLENNFDQEDFKLKMLFKNSLNAQLDEIELINTLIRDKKLNNPKYKEVKIDIIQPTIEQGFFDYYIESQELYDDGVKQAELFLEKYKEANQAKQKL